MTHDTRTLEARAQAYYTFCAAPFQHSVEWENLSPETKELYYQRIKDLDDQGNRNAGI